MVDEDVPFGDLPEDVRVGLHITKARIRHAGPGVVLELRPVECDELHERAAVEQPFGEVDLVAVDSQAVLQPFAQPRRDARGRLDPHDLAEASPPQLQLDRHPQIVGLVRDLVVGVASDAEDVLLDDLHLRKEQRREVGDDVLEGEEHPAAADAYEPWQPLRDLHTRDPLLAFFLLPHEQHEAERQRGDVGKRLTRARGERGEHRVHLLLEASTELPELVRRAVADSADDDALVGEGRLEVVEPDPRLGALELDDPPADVLQRLAHGAAVSELAGVTGVQRSMRPATRTRKNSSRFAEKIAQNLTRSSSGTCSSAARSSTLALKSSQDSSRLKRPSACRMSLTRANATSTRPRACSPPRNESG